MPLIDLPHGTVEYRVAGPQDATAPPVVFVHGFLVDGSLWRQAADALAAAGVRSYAPDWPLGSHRIPLADGADQTPRGVASQIAAFLEALDLRDVTLVGNDTGGALCQFLIDRDPSRVGRLVLTNCDAFDQFPPSPFDVLFKSFRHPAAIRGLMAPMRMAAVRHSPAGYGMLVSGTLDAAQTRSWVEPCITDLGIRRDVSRFVRAVDPQELLDVSTRLPAFAGPALLVWGDADRFFTVESGRRLAAAFADGRIVEVAGARTFLPLDAPGRLAEEIAAFSRRAAPAAPSGR